ncbi:MAG: PD40 domain-containing protein [Phycisphaerales bacterium]|nr:PD40 domain-containing protein [Phycisphaerales bacterium]
MKPMRTIPTLTFLAFCGLAVSAGGCSSSARTSSATPPSSAPAAAPAQPVSRVTSGDLAWGESQAGWDAIDAIDNLMQVSYSSDGSDFDPDVSPDGKTIVFASTQHRLTADLYLKPVGGHAVTQLTNDPAHDLMPSFSPDGSRVAFASNRNGSWDIFVVGVNGGQPVQLTSESSHELHPTWSPDGKRLAFCRLSPTSGRWELWEIELMNTAVSRFLGYGLLPEWNPKQDKIAFQRSRERGDRLYSVWTIDYVNGEPRNPTEIASSPEWAFINPSWSPDGERLVFSAVRNPSADISGGVGPTPHAADLWMVNADGSARTRLTGGEFSDLMPEWGPDGRVYFVSNRVGTGNIWSLTPQRSIVTASFGKNPSNTGLARGESPNAGAKPGAGHPSPTAARSPFRPGASPFPVSPAGPLGHGADDEEQHGPSPAPVADAPTHEHAEPHE